ncbi:MAG: YihY/virulence factor BrkB family protein [Chromatiaceae bacterium]|nr:YihY/virulence factor BrkB family protein [Gammaproteobacteria bacterium]MCP5306356.1 YihY/virulence factor BrkB family protein [Chromatiaceae bacterium]MCP5311908.1 YihY/virulence factor BrkB family protein [Chromatiaceae bacterium]
MQEGIGREAERPAQIPRKGWWQVLRRVWHRTGANNLGLISAGVAFYALLAVFPAIVALLALYGLFFDAAQASSQFSYFQGVLPEDAFRLIADQLTEVAAGSEGRQGLGVVGATLLSVWSATKGSRSLIVALNVAYDEHERRNIVRLNLTAMALTLFLVMLGVAGLAVILVVPLVLEFVGLSDATELLMALLRWPLVASVAVLMLAAIYRYGPARRNARWRWVSPGALVAVAGWVAASLGFSLYVTQFGNYNVTYGSVGAVVILLMWFFITAFVVMLGAELNAELERQTARDTTWHGEQPLGQRGAYVADHLPEDGPNSR